VGKGKVATVVEKLVKPILTENAYELVDVEFVKEGPHRYLRVYIDKEDGVSLDDCQTVSSFLNSELDRLDLIEENYFLEVSSPGIERTLKTEKDFLKFLGSKIQIKLYTTFNGQKIVFGQLIGYENERIEVKSDLTGENITIPIDKASQVKLVAEI
jgi:ribosome maturation factor RimP